MPFCEVNCGVMSCGRLLRRLPDVGDAIESLGHCMNHEEKNCWTKAAIGCVPKNRRNLVGVALCIALLGACGKPVAVGECSARGACVKRYDVGSVLEGEVVSHEFTYMNTNSVAVYISDAERDIQMNCGCAHLEVTKECVPVGDVASIVLKVDTTGRQGEVQASGRVKWTGDDGTERYVVLELRMVVEVGLTTDPQTILFSEDDVDACRHRMLLVSSRRRLDWHSLRIDTQTSVFETNVECSQSGALVTIACNPINRRERVVDRVVLTVNGESRRGEGGTCLRSVVPFEFVPDPKNAVAVHPWPVVAMYRTDGNSVKGTFLLQTSAPRSASEQEVTVSCPAGDVSSTVKWSSPHTSLVTFFIHRIPESAREDRITELEIRISGGPTIKVPVTFIDL
jgi:hypothetical protein